MGAWTFVEPRLRELANGTSILYIGKPGRPSPAQGSAKFHKQEHASIVQAAFERTGEDDEAEAEDAAEETQARASAPSE